MNTPDQRKRLLAAAGAFAVLAVCYTYVLAPLSERWRELGEEWTPKREALDAFRDQVSGQEDLFARRAALTKRLGALASVPPPPAQPPQTSKPGAPEPAKASKETPPAQAATVSQANAPGQPAPAPPATPPAQAAQSQPTPAGQPAPAGAAESPKPEKTAKKSEKEGQGGSPLAAYLETAAAQSGLKIKKISPQKTVGGPTKLRSFAAVSLQLSVGGEAENLMKFLYAVEKGPRFARVEQFEVHRGNGERMIEASLNISGYQEL